ncbi:uncharacterized protein LOC142037436 isoform X3 [Buteo buteo]|uniref:uncharacterized protein LOC142037436 isoform X3 n=2 Tax=Buteo buteo TaxID=30397 RepID=UPI003EBAD569
MADGDEPPRRAPADTHSPGTQPLPSPAGLCRGSMPSERGGRRCAGTPVPPPPCGAGCTSRTARGCGSGSAAGLCWSISASTTTGAEHPGMRTYCLGAETPEELNAWVCALRRGASPLPGSPRSLSLQMPQEPQSAGAPLPPLPAHPGEDLRSPPTPPPRRPPVPPLPPSKAPLSQEEAPSRGVPCGTKDTRGGPRGPPVGAVAAAAGRSPRELRPPGATTNQQLPPLAGRESDEAERDTAANQTLLSPTDSFHWLLASEGSDGALPLPGTAPPPSANETSAWPRAGAGGRGSGREGVAGRGSRRPIRITLLQASF